MARTTNGVSSMCGMARSWASGESRANRSTLSSRRSWAAATSSSSASAAARASSSAARSPSSAARSASRARSCASSPAWMRAAAPSRARSSRSTSLPLLRQALQGSHHLLVDALLERGVRLHQAQRDPTRHRSHRPESRLAGGPRTTLEVSGERWHARWRRHDDRPRRWQVSTDPAEALSHDRPRDAGRVGAADVGGRPPPELGLWPPGARTPRASTGRHARGPARPSSRSGG